MLEKAPEFIGKALKGVRPGVGKTVYPGIDAPETLSVESAAFADGAPIPTRHTEDGEKLSFPLRWSNVPEHAAAVVVIVEDADSPTPAPLTHVLAYDEPGGDGGWPEGALRSPGQEGQGRPLGHNSFLKLEYLPPDPPPGHGPHRYVVQVFALASAGGFDKPPGKADVVKALQRGVLAKGRLVGTYERA